MGPSPVEELAFLDLDRSTKGASKQRRDQINAQIATMRDLLPLSESARQRLSQLQIMSLSCVYIRKCNIMKKWCGSSTLNTENPFDFFQALAGFLLVTTREGKLIYISENVTEYLGHSMVDMKTQGDSMFDIIDKRDHLAVQAQLVRGSTEIALGADVAFFCRMNMSRSVKRQSGFGDVKTMHVRGHFVSVPDPDQGSEKLVLTACCCPLITIDAKDSLLHSDTMVFKSTHQLDMTFLEMSQNGEYHMGTSQVGIGGKSWYSFLHPEDIWEARSKHMQLIKSRHEMGCMLTVRMVTASGQQLWVTVVMHVRQTLLNSDDPVIVCINQVISEDEACQIRGSGFTYPTPATSVDLNCCSSMPKPASDEKITPRHEGSYGRVPQSYDFAAAAGRPPRHCQTPSGVQTAHGSGSTTLGSPCYSNVSSERQEHQTTLQALKRKLQGNGENECNPRKVPHLLPFNEHPDSSRQFYGSGGYTGQLVLNSGYPSLSSSSGSQASCMYGSTQLQSKNVYHSRHTELKQINLKQLASPTVGVEQVPDGILTPEPSPVSSPEHCVPTECEELSTIIDIPSTIHLYEPVPALVNTEKRLRRISDLPEIHVSIVESFFEELKPKGLVWRDQQVKRELPQLSLKELDDFWLCASGRSFDEDRSLVSSSVTHLAPVEKREANKISTCRLTASSHLTTTDMTALYCLGSPESLKDEDCQATAGRLAGQDLSIDGDIFGHKQPINSDLCVSVNSDTDIDEGLYQLNEILNWTQSKGVPETFDDLQ